MRYSAKNVSDGASERAKWQRRTEELVEVGVEVPHFARRDDEREDLPVRVRSVPEVPSEAGNVQAAEDLVADGLDTKATYETST